MVYQNKARVREQHHRCKIVFVAEQKYCREEDENITDDHCHAHKELVQRCLNAPAVVQLHIAGVDFLADHPHDVAMVGCQRWVVKTPIQKVIVRSILIPLLEYLNCIIKLLQLLCVLTLTGILTVISCQCL